MLSLGLGLGLCGVVLQSVLADGLNGQRLARLIRERASQQRLLGLLQSDLSQAQRLSEQPQMERSPCPLAGRMPVLHLQTAAGPVLYSVGPAPSAIWRGVVLMRCGPAVGLQGELSPSGVPQNRVVFDGLAEHPTFWRECGGLLGSWSAQAVDLGHSQALPFSACLHGESRLLAVRLEQALPMSQGLQRISRAALLRAPALID